jgi:hypothetical protein
MSAASWNFTSPARSVAKSKIAVKGATQERSHPHRRMAVRNGRELNCVCVDQM